MLHRAPAVKNGELRGVWGSVRGWGVPSDVV